MKNNFSFIYFFVFFSVHFVTAQENNWELKKNESDIKIYTRNVKGSGFKEFRAETTVTSELSWVVMILKDVDRYKEWVADIKEVKLFKADENNIYYYAETLVPWPIDNRDMVYHLQFTKTNNAEIKVIVTGIRDYIPEKKGIVRIEKAIGFWKLTSLGENKIQITYQLHAEPGGTIPEWLANLKVIDMPYTTLSGLIDMINKK
jgi:START domain-containing protein